MAGFETTVPTLRSMPSGGGTATPGSLYKTLSDEALKKKQLEQQSAQAAQRQAILDRQLALQEGEARGKLAQAEAAGKLAGVSTSKSVDSIKEIPIEGFNADEYRTNRLGEITKGLGLGSNYQLVDGRVIPIDTTKQPIRMGNTSNINVPVTSITEDTSGTTPSMSIPRNFGTPDIVTQRLPSLPTSVDSTPSIRNIPETVSTIAEQSQSVTDGRWGALNTPVTPSTTIPSPVSSREEILKGQQTLQKSYDDAVSRLDKEIRSKAFKTKKTSNKVGMTSAEYRNSLSKTANDLVAKAKTPEERAGIQLAFANKIDAYDKAQASKDKTSGTKGYFVNGQYTMLSPMEVRAMSSQGVKILPESTYNKQLSTSSSANKAATRNKAWEELKDKATQYGSFDTTKALKNIDFLEASGVQPEVVAGIMRQQEAGSWFDNTLNTSDLNKYGPPIRNAETGKMIQLGDAVEEAKNRGGVVSIDPKTGKYQLVITGNK